MWYFTWILGVSLAICLGIMNVLWYEINDMDMEDEDQQ